MAIKRKHQINSGFSMATMSDMVFLILIFFMLASTLVAPNALKLLLPQSNNQTAAKAITTISITKELLYYINDEGNLRQVAFQEIEPYLKMKFRGKPESYVSLHTDRSVPVDQVVKIMNIASRNQLKLILACAPDK